MSVVLLLFLALVPTQILGNSAKEQEFPSGWTWDRILNSSGSVVANGNIWPPTEKESANDCLILVTRNQLMWHCPEGDDLSYKRTILYRDFGRRFRGAFSAPGTARRRLWILDSPQGYDRLLELDTVTGEVLQKLVIGGTADAHDAVRVEDRVFIVDTKNGNVVELELPASAAPYTESSVHHGAKEVKEPGFVTIIKRHTGFTRSDHINNVAVHPQLLISNLHGGSAISPKVRARDEGPSATRLSALSRSISEEQGRELNLEQDGFSPIDNVGTWCHGIAFWKDKETAQIKLISLDSKEGTMVSVVLSGINKGAREVLWAPNLDHPVLVPPEGIARAYNKGAQVFSKGIAVQGGVAYFAVSYARAPQLRQTVPESLLVAVDLETKEELWLRRIHSNGLINQILTESYLGWQFQLPPEMFSVEVTYHGHGGKMVQSCEDIISEGSIFCERFKEDSRHCNTRSSASIEAKSVCCACKGGRRIAIPHLAGTLDAEAMEIKENVTATATFVQSHQCLEKNGITKHVPLEMKVKNKILSIASIDRDLDSIVKHICNLNVEPLQERLLKIGDDAFTSKSQQRNGNAIITGRNAVMTNIKPGTTSIQLIFSSRDASTVYHFPWLDDWLPTIQEFVLQPLGIPVRHIIRMMFANMPKGSTINFHRDLNGWVQTAHRVHVPIITHPGVFFLTRIRGPGLKDQVLRIKSTSGEAFEFNNAMLHAVRNLGNSRVHLILDWIEGPVNEQTENGRYSLVKLRPGDTCDNLKQFNELQCVSESTDAEKGGHQTGEL